MSNNFNKYICIGGSGFNNGCEKHSVLSEEMIKSIFGGEKDE
ncbi:MAG: hypothetical protein N3D20_03160 [Candidatus Pacearchaeota archaeon]|nr:hypothetical protein [Candidatus Pacearchaeota archaeon]